jgi:hypothetical protein
MDNLLFMKGHRCICGELVDPVILEKRQLMRAGQGIRSGPVFISCGILKNNSSADFTNSRFDERKGVIAAHDYCSYHR